MYVLMNILRKSLVFDTNEVEIFVSCPYKNSGIKSYFQRCNKLHRK